MKKMKSILATASILMMSLTFSACDEEGYYYYDDEAPDSPRGVSAFFGDGFVELSWDYNYEDDVEGYNVYWAYEYYGEYKYIGSTTDNYFVDEEAENGYIYYYAIVAYDYNGNESELSSTEIFGAARPEGFNQTIYDYTRYPGEAGYSFAGYQIVDYTDIRTDFFFENYNGRLYLNVWADDPSTTTDIQDMGHTSDIYDVVEAPEGGWVPLVSGENVKYVEAKSGHTYVIWTADDNYAKIRIGRASGDRMVFDWAYQLVPGFRQLKRNISNGEKKPHPTEVIRNN
ncbi:MAG: hypothetical protein V1720_10465 [bacterium]